MRIVVAGAGVGGLAAAVRLAALGHEVTVCEQARAPGGKCGLVEIGGWRFDSGPSLLTMPWVLGELFADTGAPLEKEMELLRVEPVTSYRFADGSQLELSADLPRALEALEAWSPGAGADWVRFLGVCAGMWRASIPFLTGAPPWPPRRPLPGEPAPDPRDLLRVKPWHTLSTLARACARDPRLRMVIERFATYAGADPRRAPAALAVAGYVEHAFGAWHPRGGMYALVQALARRLEALGGELRLKAPVQGIELRGDRIAGVKTGAEAIACDALVWNGDAAALAGLLPSASAGRRRGGGEPSLSGFALMLGLRGRERGLAHHTILFPDDYGAEFDDIFERRRSVRDPTLYLACSSATDSSDSPEGNESLFVLVNAAVHGAGMDWDAEADAYEAKLLELMAERGVDVRDRIEVSSRRTPADLERETGALGGAIYGRAPHGRLGTLRRPGQTVPGVDGLWRVGGTVHPGGGLPLVMLGAKAVAEQIDLVTVHA